VVLVVYILFAAASWYAFRHRALRRSTAEPVPPHSTAQTLT
jgi:hypothetical protein